MEFHDIIIMQNFTSFLVIVMNHRQKIAKTERMQNCQK